jgi:hypothetical protein
MTREEKFRLMLEKYAENSPENVVSDKAEKAEKALQRCYRLYEQGKIKNEVTRLINQKNMELREQKELSECTFKPKTNKLNRKSSVRDFEENRIYDRAINWKKRKIEKYIKIDKLGLIGKKHHSRGKSMGMGLNLSW